MSAVQLIVALVLLAVGSALLFRWLQSRHEEEWHEGTKTTAHDKRKHSKSNDPHRSHRRQPRGGAAAARDAHDGDSVESPRDEEEASDDADSARGPENRLHLGGRHNRNAGAGGLRRRGPQRGAHNNSNNNDERGANVDDDDDGDEYDVHGVKLTRLQRKKLAKEREKEERRLAQEAALDALRQRTDNATLRDAEAALKEEELKRAEELALRELRAEKAQKDNEEYAKWVGHIGVEERGELGDETRERQVRVQDYLRRRATAVQARAQRGTSASTPEGDTAAVAEAREDEINVLVLQSSARDLRVSVEELVQTIEQMMRDGEVDGVFDDRGKYVLIAPEHFPQLAQFIRLRGRVSVQEFTRECNRIIMQC